MSLPSQSRFVHGVEVAVVLFILVIHIAGRVGSYCSPYPADSYIFTSFGYRMAHGDALYRDMSDIKPPGLFALYALSYLILPASRSSAVPIESAFLLLAYYVLFRAGAALFGRSIGLAVCAVGALTINYFTITGHAIEGFGLAENFMVFPAVAAVLCYHHAARSDRGWWFAVAGLALGFDTTLKQTALPVVVAIGVHWAVMTLVCDRNPRRWLVGVTWLTLGGVVAWLPFVVTMTAQGTLSEATGLLTRDAGAMIARGTAWPTQWRVVQPLWWPGIAMICGALAWVERLARRVNRKATVLGTDVFLLAIWGAAELALLWVLPLRSPHYYVAGCAPFVLLFGAALRVLGDGFNDIAPRARAACWSAVLVGAAVCYLPTVEAIVPTAIARYRSYDWQADLRRFDEAVNWGRIHFGRGEPFVE